MNLTGASCGCRDEGSRSGFLKLRIMTMQRTGNLFLLSKAAPAWGDPALLIKPCPRCVRWVLHLQRGSCVSQWGQKSWELLPSDCSSFPHLQEMLSLSPCFPAEQTQVMLETFISRESEDATVCLPHLLTDTGWFPRETSHGFCPVWLQKFEVTGSFYFSSSDIQGQKVFTDKEFQFASTMLLHS